MNQIPFPNINIPSLPDISAQISSNFQNLVVGYGMISPNSVGSNELASAIKDTDSRIEYSTGWTLQTASATAPAGYVGGYDNLYHNTTTANAAMQFSDVMQSIYIYCITGPNCGKVQVQVDSGAAQTVDLYASTFSVQQIYSQSLSYGTHTVKMSVLSTKNSSSTGYNVNFVGLSEMPLIQDNNIIPGALSQISVSSVNANSGIIGGWNISNDTLSSGQMSISASTGIDFNGTFTVDASGNATVTSLKFNGGSIDIGSGALSVNSVGVVTIGNSGSLELQGAINLYDNVNSRNAGTLSSGNNTIDFQELYAGTFRWMGAALQTLATLDYTGLFTPQNIAIAAATTQTTSPSSGAAGALPSTPAGYVEININGVNRLIPYY